MKNRKLPYTEEELLIITKLYATTPAKVIATWMPHSSISISKKALEKAKVIGNFAQTIINSASVEN